MLTPLSPVLIYNRGERCALNYNILIIYISLMTIDSCDADGRYCYRYPRAALTADCVVFGFDGDRLKILLVERACEPFAGMWALPGGFMRMDETIEQCAARELREEANVSDVYLEQFRVFSSTARDPRGRVVTVAFLALVRPSGFNIVGGDDASAAMWFDDNMLPPLAFDHREIIAGARLHLKQMLRTSTAAFRLVGEVFSVDDIRKVYEAINGVAYDRRNFQRKLLQSEIIEEAPIDCGGCFSRAQDEPSGRRGQRASRFFSLREAAHAPNSKACGENDSEGSIKDLFQF